MRLIPVVFRIGVFLRRVQLLLPAIHSRILQLDQNDVRSDLYDIAPWNDNIRPAVEKTEKLAVARHDNGIDPSLPQVQVQIAHLTEFFAVHDIDDILRLEIRNFHDFITTNLKYCRYKRLYLNICCTSVKCPRRTKKDMLRAACLHENTA